jgi:hypothetical protein
VPECKAMYNYIISIKNIMMLVTLWELAQDP